MRALFLLVFFTFLCFHVFASEDHKYEGNNAEGSLCEAILTDGGTKVGPIDIRSSGRDGKVLRQIEEATLELTEIAAKLDYHTPPHQMIFAPSDQLAQLVAVGGYAAPHWYDGQKIVSGAESLAGVMEFVTGGCPTCRSFYRDTTEFREQVSIVAHVLGHNDHRMTNAIAKARDADPVKATWDIAELLRDLYSRYDRDEVMTYYQMLLSMINMSDFAKGSYQPPEAFKNEIKTIDSLRRVALGQSTEKPNANPYTSQRRPVRPTPSAFQAFVSNMPESTPEWKRKLAALVEKANSAYSSNVKTRIQNEGWATFSQFLLLRHSSFTSDSDLVQMSRLMSGVAPSHNKIGIGGFIQNPYSIGVSAWLHEWENFRNRPEIKAIDSELEKDRLFVRHAHSIIETSDDSRFLRRTLDEDWVKKRKIRLSRVLDFWEKWERGLDPNKEYRVIVSVHHERIIDYIARSVTYGHKQFPRVLLADLNHRGQEAYYVQQMYEDWPIPLERFSAAQTLFVLSHIHERPVSLDMKAPKSWWEPRDNQRPDNIVWGPFSSTEQDSKKSIEDEYIPIRITVTPEGRVRAYRLPRTDQETVEALTNEYGADLARKSTMELNESHIIPELTQQLQGAIDYYVQDIQASVSPEFMEYKAKGVLDIDSWNRVIDPELVDKIVYSIQSQPSYTRAVDAVSRHAPTAGEAIIERDKLLKTRLDRALRMALTGHAPVKFGDGKVKIRALPMIPSFKYDQRVLRQWMSEKPNPPIDERFGGSRVHVGVDDNVDISVGDGLPGDVQEIPKGDGQGQEPSKPEDGDDNEDRPEDFDGEGGDPSVVEFDAELWGEVLNSYFELPNPRRTSAGAADPDWTMEGTATREHDRINAQRTADVMLENAIAKNPELIKPVPGESPADRVKRLRQLLIEGGKYTPTDEYKVRAWQQVYEPQFKAVVVFVIDLTGSQMGLPQEMAKKFVYSVINLLKNNYPEVDIRFIGYDDKAYEFSEEDIWTTFLGGGNTDSTGYILAEQILNEYDPEEFNMYVYGTGDSGSNDTEPTIASMERLYRVVQHMGYVQNNSGWIWSDMPFRQAIEDMSNRRKWMDYTEITEETSSIISALNDFYGKHKNAERSQQNGE